ncbi:MAG: PAS domain-containing protein [Desulfovibrionaceae bacterium]|nr:PAS domain-containing protein [Desulfovibrionaceae bacterium]
MDAEINTERSTVFLAVITLVIVGLGLVIGLWQIIQRQEEAMREHLMLASRSVLQAVESTLWRGYFAHPEHDLGITPETADFFHELEQSGDVIFVSIMDSSGEKIITSLPGSSYGEVHFDPEALANMVEMGEWGGYMPIGRKDAYVYVRRVSHPNDGKRPEKMEAAYLVVAFDVARHQAAYKSFKQNLQFQTIYILLAALAVLVLAISFLKRRALAGRAVVLERFQAALLDRLPDGLMLLSENGKIEAANPAAHKILQIPHGSLVGRMVNTLSPEISQCLNLDRVPATGAWRHCIMGGAHLEILVQPFASGDEVDETARNQTIILIRDRTEIRELEKSLNDAEKLATVGTLAAGMAHEIRNPLSALRGFAQYFAKKFAGKMPEEKYAQTMVLEADRLNRVITDLLDLARPKHIEPRLVDLNAMVEGLKTLISFDLNKSGASLKCELEKEEVFADEDSLKRALLNLIINSLEALGAEGENREIELLSHSGDGGVWLTVRDQGSGMTDEQKEQAFEPFYTGKPNGTGLGLALVHKTMREHNGKITLDSVSGKGTTISLFFPSYNNEAAENSV